MVANEILLSTVEQSIGNATVIDETLISINCFPNQRVTKSVVFVMFINGPNRPNGTLEHNDPVLLYRNQDGIAR